MRAYTPVVSIRALFAALVALAVLFAPSVTRVGEAWAAVPDHHAQMMSKGHCEKAAGDEREMPVDTSCCVQMCMAVAVEPAAPFSPEPVLGSTKTPELQNFLVGLPAEIATPPPRAA